MINAKDIVKTEIVLDELGLPDRISQLENKKIWTISGVRTINSEQPDDQGNINITTSSALITKDEGISLTSETSSLDFVGGGVTATAIGNNVTVTVPTGAGGVSSITGTANQVLANGNSGTNEIGAVTLSLPVQVALPTSGLTGGLLLRGDVLIYGDAADVLRTPDSLRIDGALGINAAAPTTGRVQVTGANTSLTADSTTVNITASHTVNSPDTTTGRTWGLQFEATQTGSGIFNDGSTFGATGIQGLSQFSGSGSSVGVSGIIGVARNTSTGTLTRAAGLVIVMTGVNTGGGHITNLRPIDISWNTTFTATNQTRMGIRIGAGPTNHGSFAGSITGGVWFNSSSRGIQDGLLWGTGGDTNLYSSATDTLRTDDSFISGVSITAGTQFVAATSGTTGGLVLGGDTQLYRRTTDIMSLAAGDSLEIPSGNLAVGSTINTGIAGDFRLSPGNATAYGTQSYVRILSGNTSGAFPVASVGHISVDSGISPVFYAVGLNGQARIEAAHAANVDNIYGSDNFTWMMSVNGISVANMLGGVFQADIQGGATGTVNDLRAGAFGTYHNQSSTVVVTSNFWGYFGGNIPAGGITTARGLYIGSASRTTGHATTFDAIYQETLVAFSANNQVRRGLYLAGVPAPGAFTGTTAAAIWLAGTSGTARDGITFYNGTVNLYPSATDTLKTDDILDSAVAMNVSTTGSAVSATYRLNSAGAGLYSPAANEFGATSGFIAFLTSNTTSTTLISSNPAAGNAGHLYLRGGVGGTGKVTGTGGSIYLYAGSGDIVGSIIAYQSNGSTKVVEINDSGIGFFGTTPAGRQTYTITNVTTDRAYDANATTLDEVADTLGTLIADLRSLGLVA